MRIAVTGHRGLSAELQDEVAARIRAHIGGAGPGTVGLSCLADGPDALFAHAVLDNGGTLEAVVPASRYRAALPHWHLDDYDALLDRAVRVHRLPNVESTSESHLDAGRHLVEHCDELVAVWDGHPARGPGGTADVVAHARAHDRPVHVIWPEGARR
ncbi:hypothetical protein CLV63_106127 [Murinocardiopsis flavida]|uniref:Uncharacterized protein n=1 Tax=Murinocardiopsis flavida TaxID=645275 RepID=A0A2P8DLI2_9ACTN|nr:hypothetical protein [Murinocardiopsis flavida]PSK98079.1 hypothetical protein CLV63_106127 [Murinocardiopsis flavida]